jgi:hypothetical protein
LNEETKIEVVDQVAPTLKEVSPVKPSEKIAERNSPLSPRMMMTAVEQTELMNKSKQSFGNASVIEMGDN